jgi:hypothetical protein
VGAALMTIPSLPNSWIWVWAWFRVSVLTRLKQYSWYVATRLVYCKIYIYDLTKLNMSIITWSHQLFHLSSTKKRKNQTSHTRWLQTPSSPLPPL